MFKIKAFIIGSVAFIALATWLKPIYQVPPLAPLFTQTSKQDEVFYKSEQLIDLPTHAVHAFSVIAMDKELLGIWYGGSKEAKPDVSLYSAKFQPDTQTWSEARKIQDSPNAAIQTNRFTRLIGNATGIYAHGKIYLFFVTVGPGGWAASSLNLMISEDKGQNWGPIQKLYTSAALNVSTLLRNPPKLLENGDILLPAYFETGTKYGWALVISPQGQVLYSKQLTTPKWQAIQPDFVAFEDNKLNLVYRTMNKSQPYLVSNSLSLPKLSVSNPTHHQTNIFNADSGLSTLIMNSKEALLVYNHQEEGRETIDLAITMNSGQKWQHLVELESNPGGRLGYPATATDYLGNYHVFYTVNRKSFRHLQFNRNWVDQQTQKIKAESNISDE